jgi:Aminoglycoside adenylyltransferase, C-terminal domain/Nucleotidyltransferase domain
MDAPPAARAVVDRYLGVADRLLPDRIVGTYIVGSVALGAYRPDRSDIDVVAVLDRDLSRGERWRLRAAHVAAGAQAGSRSLARGRLNMPGMCNGVFVRADDLAKPVSTIVPVASQTGTRFAVGRGFDVNPVVWKILAESGIPVRGPAPATLGLDPEPDRLRSWNLANLDAYWRPWGERTAHGKVRVVHSVRWHVAWGTLGAPRLHHTIATGEVVSKEAAGEYARDRFGTEWRPVIDTGLAYWRGEPGPRDTRRVREAGEFVLAVIEDARAL